MRQILNKSRTFQPSSGKVRDKYHPLAGRILFWNVLMLVFVKLVFPQSAFQLASIINSIPVFDSREIIITTNEARSSQNLPPLKANTKLDLAASEKLNHMASKEYFAHVSPDGVTPWFWIKDNQYQYSVAGENLAIGFFTPDETVKAWLNSPSHRANILNSKYQDIGVAVQAVKIGNREGLLVVQMFGTQNIQADQPSPQVAVSFPVPIPTIPTPILQLALATPSQTPETRGELTVGNLISTDTSIEPVNNPISVTYTNAKTISTWSKRLNNVFSTYAFVVAMFALLAFYLSERNRNSALKTSINFAIFLLAIFLPIYQLSFTGLIF